MQSAGRHTKTVIDLRCSRTVWCECSPDDPPAECKPAASAGISAAASHNKKSLENETKNANSSHQSQTEVGPRTKEEVYWSRQAADCLSSSVYAESVPVSKTRALDKKVRAETVGYLINRQLICLFCLIAKHLVVKISPVWEMMRFFVTCDYKLNMFGFKACCKGHFFFYFS